jgi:hypothetical protein
MEPIHFRKRSILIGVIFVTLTLITVLYIDSNINNYYTVFQNFQLYHTNNRIHLSSIRVFCLILTTPKYFVTRAKAVNETWAPRCDRYFFITEYPRETMTSEQINFAEQIPIAPIKNIRVGYDHLTQK